MSKTITISPQTMVALVGGARLRALNVPAVQDAKIVKCGFDAGRQEFWVEVSSDSFDDRFAEKRMPQEFRLETQK